MDAPSSADAPRPADYNKSAQAPSIHSATSQAFHQEIPHTKLIRSMLITGLGSTVGMVMFTAVQQTPFNFFMEDMGLKERIPWFFGLQWLAGIGSILGSWIQERWGHRRLLMFTCCGITRLTWLLVGLLPIIFPQSKIGGGLFGWFSFLIFFFYFVHSVGANAWLTWMSDLVPPRYQTRFWSWRQVFTTGSSAAARIGFGAFLEHQRNNTAYAIIFGIAALTGVIDVACYAFVEHRSPALVTARRSILKESLKRLKDLPFRRLCGVYLLWNAANLIMAPTIYYFMREYVQMGPWDISLCMTISMVAYALSSLYWGNFGNREGHRRAVIACLIIQNVCTFFYIFCKPGSTTLTTTASTLEQIGYGGVNLFMFPLLIDYTKGKGGGRAVGMAAFTGLLSIVSFAACVLADQHIFRWTAGAFNAASGAANYRHDSVAVYFGVMWICFALRAAALALAVLLPACERQRAAGPGTLILRRMSEGPLRAAQAMFTSVTGRPDSDLNSSDDADK
ncbi:MAG TPA: MFS transporter [Planctomycetota bacterium]|nr:MFS transporter [Planctomycetota bacterium]